MKLRVKRLFKYMFDNVTTHKLLPGEYDVPGDVAENAALLAIQFGAAVWINTPLKEVAPENKVVMVPENKMVKAPENKKRYKRKGPRKPSKKRASRNK